MLRHERQTVAMELAAALHHSRDVGPELNEGLQAQKAASSGEVEAHETRARRPTGTDDSELRDAAGASCGGVRAAGRRGGAVTVGYVAAPVPTLALPVLAGSVGEAVDDRTLRFLLGRSLAEKKEEEEKRRKGEVEEYRLASLARARELYGSKRKRKKRRKRRLPCSPRPLLRGRAHRRLRQWNARYAGFPGYVVRAVFPSVVVRPEMPCTMAGMDQKDRYALGSGIYKAGIHGDKRCFLFPGLQAQIPPASWPVFSRSTVMRLAVARTRLVLLVTVHFVLCSLLWCAGP